MSAAQSDRYRVEWWVACGDGEWGGRWDECDGATAARGAAIQALTVQAGAGVAMIVTVSPDGREICRAAADAGELESWNPGVDALPATGRDPASLPPMGREDLGHLLLGTCRTTLLAAVDAGLLAAIHVAPLVEIIHQTFMGVGPVVDAADPPP